eukprot:756354-Hanusia_phi.AAC.2
MQEKKTRSGIGIRIADTLAEVDAHTVTTVTSVNGWEESKSKFSMEGGNDAVYGTLGEFHGGLVNLIGLPSKLDDLCKAMEEEHCDRNDSDETFTPPNYSTPTTPKLEWHAVTDPTERKRLSPPEGKRRIKAIDDLMKDERVKMARLRREEVVALVLYTGPMYVKFNKILRAAKKGEKGGANHSNKYPTTIHCIVSGVIKLSKLTKLPSSRVVYRGLNGLRMPDRFLQEDDLGVSGGVEYGMLSTTEDMKVAIQYAGRGRQPTVFEITCGAIDRGADLEFLSQYPGEKEMLYPPLSYLEVTKRPRIEQIQGQLVRVLQMKINANVTCSTIEETLGKRKQLYTALLDNVVEEIWRDLELMMHSQDVKERLSQATFDSLHELHKKLQESILAECEAIVRKHKMLGILWYNDDVNYVQAMEQATGLKEMAINKLKYWLVSTTEDWQCDRLSNESMAALYRKTLAELHRKASVGGVSESEAKDAAEKACRMQGVWRVKQDLEADDESPILTATKKGQADMIMLLAKAGSELNGKCEDGSTALHIAATLGFIHCLQELVGQGADINARGKQGETCAHTASKRGHVGALKYLGDVGGRELLTQTDNDGGTCAHWASKEGYVDVLEYLGEVGGKDLITQRDDSGRTCAHLASKRGHVGALKYLREVGGQELLIQADKDGGTCAHEASYGGHLGALQYLGEQGGRKLLAQRDNGGRTCAHQASYGGHVAALKYLREVGGQELLNQTDNDGGTCAHWAGRGGHLEVLEYLGEVGSRELITKKDNSGHTCAMWASREGYVDVLKYLEDLGVGLPIEPR